MEWGLFKPVLTNLILPPAGPILLVLACWALIWRSRARWVRGLGHAGLVATLILTWLLSCNAVAVWLARHILPQYSPILPEQIRQQAVQAIVVLGGGVDQVAPEYGKPDLFPPAYMRLRYGIHLAGQLNLPLAVSGGLGWSAHAPSNASEAEVAAQIAQTEWRQTVSHVETKSRDTRENALFTRQLLPSSIHRIALVTNAWHMPRSVAQFEAAGFEVVAAPMGYILQAGSPVNRWTPSATGLRDSSWVLRERLGLWLTAPPGK